MRFWELAGTVAVAVVLPLAAPSARAQTPAGLTVVGIVIPDGGHSLAAIEDRTTARTQLYRVGDTVNGGVVTAIARDRVTLAFGGQPTLMRLAIQVGDRPGGGATRDTSAADRPASSRGAALTEVGADLPRGPYGQMGAILPGAGTAGATGGGPSGGITPSAGGPAGGGSGGGGTGGSAGGATLAFTGVLHNKAEQSGETFSGDSLRDLLISVTLTNLAATTQRLELTTPDGSVYQQYTGAALPASQVRVPVGGTWITEHGLYGTWSVGLYLDRARTPAATEGFTLNR